MDSGVALLTIFILSIFVGFEVVSKVSTVLHTPLMSGANAIHGIVLVGAILVTGSADNPLTIALGLIAIVPPTECLRCSRRRNPPSPPLTRRPRSDLATRIC